jgi:hypothetical protein
MLPGMAVLVALCKDAGNAPGLNGKLGVSPNFIIIFVIVTLQIKEF